MPTRDLFLLGAAVVGLLVSAYLAVLDLTGGSALCLVGSDCDIVRSSTYGQVAGLPVTALGVTYFLTVLVAGLLRARWQPRLLQVLGGVGLGAVVVFVAIQALVLRAWCPYCLVADAAALAIALRVFWPRQTGPTALLGGGLARGVAGASLAAVVLLVGYVVNPSPTVGAVSPPAGATGAPSSTMSADQLATLADHLRESGAVFYGAYWCPHCQTQKQMFGSAAERLPYVECDPRGTDGRPDLCQAAGVRAYPTWVIDGSKIEGGVSPDNLARLSGFER